MNERERWRKTTIDLRWEDDRTRGGDGDEVTAARVESLCTAVLSSPEVDAGHHRVREEGGVRHGVSRLVRGLSLSSLSSLLVWLSCVDVELQWLVSSIDGTPPRLTN